MHAPEGRLTLALLSFAAILVSDYDLVLGFSCPEDIRRRLTSGLTHKSEEREGSKVTNKLVILKNQMYTFIQANC